ncbi:hypothetical protein [Leptolyngbya sp. KIOST-1]|uniref:hypothetical protein n=1 Tax=Leptolyngbya sp. KIOST-1 TaxID=1229172 RepID=UPI000A829691|nr:hypothetical protein [Leptolyngbya sp. KIOST-1]
MAQQVPGIERLTPNQGKDWNEMLVNPEGGGNGWQQSRPELGQLWGWHGQPWRWEDQRGIWGG